uniref:protein FMC1 homolog isoform X6 n=1 Tax=Osmia lignaria TaxID=473952 RepID=UPI001478E015|nr:protein FMC1 homolog isoform X6 [Osmia lignaria]
MHTVLRNISGFERLNRDCPECCIHDFYSKVVRKMKPNAKLVRSLIQEIRRVSSDRSAKNNTMVQYILEQARSHRETSEILCKAREELKNLAETYLCYLNSQRMCKEIQVRYTGKGERSIRETADLVGFKLPHDPK